MSNAMMFISFRLAKGASERSFLLASEKLHRDFMSKQKGYVSWKQLVDGETWVDLLTWETMDDARNADEAGCENALAHTYFSFIDQESMEMRLYSVKRDDDSNR